MRAPASVRGTAKHESQRCPSISNTWSTVVVPHGSISVFCVHRLTAAALDSFLCCATVTRRSPSGRLSEIRRTPQCFRNLVEQRPGGSFDLCVSVVIASSLPHPGDRRRHRARIAHRPPPRIHLCDERTDDAVEFVRVLDVDRMPAIRHHRQRRAADASASSADPAPGTASPHRRSAPASAASAPSSDRPDRTATAARAARQAAYCARPLPSVPPASPELGEPARILVLELHACRAIRILRREHLHPLFRDERRNRLCLGAKSLGLPALRAVAAARDAKRQRTRRDGGTRNAAWRTRPSTSRPRAPCRSSGDRAPTLMSSAARVCEYFATSSGTSDGG